MAEALAWVFGIAFLLVTFIAYRLAVVATIFRDAMVAAMGQASEINYSLHRLIDVAKPFTAKTSFTFQGGPHGRAEEVTRNNHSESLRKVLFEITSDPQRPQNLDGEAKGLPVIMYEYPGPHRAKKEDDN